MPWSRGSARDYGEFVTALFGAIPGFSEPGRLAQGLNATIFLLQGHYAAAAIAGVSAMAPSPEEALSIGEALTGVETGLADEALPALEGSFTTDNAIADSVIDASEAVQSEAYSAIGSTGQVGEDALKALGGESQVYFRTSLGGRYVDQLIEGVANESKVGYQSLTPTIRVQIAKDMELIQTEKIEGAAWHFFQSPVTNLGGLSQPLLKALQQAGFKVVIY